MKEQTLRGNLITLTQRDYSTEYNVREEYTNRNKKVKKATQRDRDTFVEDMAEEAVKAAAGQIMSDLYQIQ